MSETNTYVRVTNSESSARLWALESKVRELAGADPVFQAAMEKDPLNAMRERFGDAAMPNEGEHVRVRPDGTRELVFPKTNAAWQFAAGDELPDALLDCVSAGGQCTGPVQATGPSTSS
jgi:hypothetical protein